MLRKKVGRPKGAISKKRAMAMDVMSQLEAELGRKVNPLEGLLRIGSDTSQPVSVRVQCMAEALPYIYPKLQAQAVQVTREDDVEVHLDISAIMASPDAVEAAQTLALAMADQRRGEQEPIQRALPSGPVDVLSDLEKQPNGHWAK